MMRSKRIDMRSGERGSAMIIAVLVMVMLTLLGISFLLMAETENRIAENERLGLQALYFGEAGVRQIKRWFDYPSSANNLINPPLDVIDRSLRWIDDDGDPATPATPNDGVANGPLCRFKQGWDPNSDGFDDVFEKPYRAGPTFALMGTEDHPDMRIDEDASTAARTFLTDLSNTLLPDFPNQNYRARIRTIDIYAPPYVNRGASWVRYGMGTIKVVARIFRTLEDGTEQILAERMIKAVLNETPYYGGALGPLHSCSQVLWNGDFSVHWGLTSAVGSADLTSNQKKIPASLARETSPNPRLDRLWGWTDYQASGTAFQSYVTALTGSDVTDPWSRVLAGSVVVDPVSPIPMPPATDAEPFKYPWIVGTPLGDDDYEAGVHQGGTTGSLSHVQQGQPVSCIELPYDVWKAVATSGEGDVHYYTWSSGTSFKENGFGTAQTFESLTDDKTGLFFFDTKDGVAPYTASGNPPPTDSYLNLTPQIKMSGGTWGVRGFVYLNAESFQTKGVGGRDAAFQAPGEPYLDLNNNTVHDGAEPWIDLTYPTTLTSGGVPTPFTVAGLNGSYDERGPGITDDAVVWGILYNNGKFDATGNARYYGSVLTRSGMEESAPSAGTPEIWWDESIKINWPPVGWELPRVVITMWETDL